MIFYAAALLLTACVLGALIRWQYQRSRRNGVIGTELIALRRRNRNKLIF